MSTNLASRNVCFSGRYLGQVRFCFILHHSSFLALWRHATCLDEKYTDSNIDPKSCVFLFSCVFILQQLQSNTVYTRWGRKVAVHVRISSSSLHGFFVISISADFWMCVSCSKFTYIKLLLLIDNNNWAAMHEIKERKCCVYTVLCSIVVVLLVVCVCSWSQFWALRTTSFLARW